jgi:hypothetical protein
MASPANSRPLQVSKLGNPVVCQIVQFIELGAGERLGFRGALHLNNAAAAGEDKIGVRLG